MSDTVLGFDTAAQAMLLVYALVVGALLGALLCLSSLGFSAPLRRHYRLPLCIGVLYAASDELHQAFVPGRGPAVGDVVLDGVGVLFGIAVVLLFARRIWKKKKTNRC